MFKSCIYVSIVKRKYTQRKTPGFANERGKRTKILVNSCQGFCIAQGSAKVESCMQGSASEVEAYNWQVQKSI